MCLAVEFLPGAWVYHSWLEQGSLDLEGMWEAAMATEILETEV